MPMQTAKSMLSAVSRDGYYSSVVYAYDVATDTWSVPLAPLPQTEIDMACGVINNKIYVAGGNTEGDHSP